MHNKIFVTFTFVIIFVLLSETNIYSLRLVSKNDIPSLDKIYNPKPLDGDIILPMPGGLGMVLRAVCIPASGYLDDSKFTFGVNTSEDESGLQSAAWADQQYKASLLAPFEINNIPDRWDKSVKNNLLADPIGSVKEQNGLHNFLYFIGKYEVTVGQWRAVMNTEIEYTPRVDDDKPMTNISWFDAVAFTRFYSEWLMQNHPEYLPFFEQEQRSSFIRLPTETEWEYAARGGHKVSPAERDRTRLYPVPEGADMGEYIIAAHYDNKLTHMAGIGSKKPNPLGMFDVLGNSAEMVQTPFQLIAAGHLIGNQGGFVIKGGSWRAYSEGSLHPGKRIEAAYFIDGRAQKRDDLGFRVSLGTILMPKDRRANMEKEWEISSSPIKNKSGASEDVRVIIREVVHEVESPILRKRLEEAEAVAARYNAQMNESHDHMIHEMLLGAAFSLETLANYASRYFQLVKMIDAIESLSKDEKISTKNKVVEWNSQIKGFILGMKGTLYYYKNLISNADSLEESRIIKQMEKLKLQFVHEDGFSKNMTRRLLILQKHIRLSNKERNLYSDLDFLKDILPDWLLERLKNHWKSV